MKAVARSQTYQACEPMADDGLTGCNYTCEQQVIAQQLCMGEQSMDRTVSTPTSSHNNMLCILAFFLIKISLVDKIPNSFAEQCT